MMLRDARRDNKMALAAGVAGLAVAVTLITALMRGSILLAAWSGRHARNYLKPRKETK